MASKAHKVSLSLSFNIDNSLVRDSHKASSRLISRLILASFLLAKADVAVVRDEEEVDDGELDRLASAAAVAGLMVKSDAAPTDASTDDLAAAGCNDDDDDG